MPIQKYDPNVRWFEKEKFIFEPNMIEIERIKAWIHEHRKTCIESNRKGSMFHDTHFTFGFSPTSCGDVVSVTCSACKTTHGVTDTDSW